MANNINVRDFSWQVIINPNACDKMCFNHWSDISQLLQARGISHELHKADACGKGKQVAAEICRQGHRHIMAIGGDGTINEVVNGIMVSGVPTNEVYLAVLPLGRGNDWARTHGFPNSYMGSLEVFTKGTFLQHDVGKIDVIKEGESQDERYFINIAGFCFDAEVIYDVTYNKPHFLGLSVYMLGLARTLFRYRSRKVHVQSPEFDFNDKMFLMVAGICQYNGGGMRQVPMAVPDDGMLDVVVIPKVSNFRVIANVKNISTGEHVRKIKCVKTCRTNQVRVTSANRVRAEVEGELLPLGDYTISVLPHALNMLTAL